MRSVWILAVVVASIVAPFARADSPCPPEWDGFRPPDSNLEICWSLSQDILHVEMSHPGRVWIALGFGAAMNGADAVVGRPETGEVLDMFIGGYDVASILPDARQDIREHSAVFSGGRTMVKFSRALDTGDGLDRIIVAEHPTSIIWAVGDAPGFSAHFARGVTDMDWGRGASFAWSTGIILHSIMMLLAWMLIMPLGVIIARYYKVLGKQDFPKELDNQFWWHWHLALQYGGMLLAMAGLGIVWSPQKGIDDMHAVVGIVAMVMGVLQVVGGLLRGSKGGPVDDSGHPNPPEKIRGDHYDMTRRRRVFEFFHKSGGYVALGMGYIAVVLGLWQTDAHWIAYAVSVVWICIIIACFFCLQKSGRWMDTYHAIWGQDTRHPGNRARMEKDQNVS